MGMGMDMDMDMDMDMGCMGLQPSMGLQPGPRNRAAGAASAAGVRT